MNSYEEKDYGIFKMFRQWGLVTAGIPGHFNSCTVGWGSMGVLWAGMESSGAAVTIYLHPDRYTCDFVKEHDTFTLSFFPAKYKKALGYMGTHSGRDGDKAAAGLTPVPMGDSMTYEEANLVFLCRKVYQQQFSKECMSPEILRYHEGMLPNKPADGPEGWQPHWFFIGQIMEVKDVRKEGDQDTDEPFDFRDLFAGMEPPDAK